MGCRILYQNLVQGPAAVLSASSYQASLPPSFLRDPLRTKVVRTSLGWDVTSGVFDRIDVTIAGTPYVATITAGSYTTGALYAAAVQAALTAAVANAWSVSYSSTTGLFTIAGSAAFILKLATGTNVARSAGPDLGFAVADTGAATSVAGGTAVYQSRRWLKVDLGSAQAITSCVVINHNAGSGGTFTIQGNATDAWTGPSFTQALAGNSTARLAYFGSQSFRYFRLLIEDQGNTAGFSEVGVWYAGPYVAPTYNYSINFGYQFNDLSSFDMAPGGAVFQNLRSGRPKTWPLEWLELPVADRDILEAVGTACPRGTHLFFNFDSTDSGPSATSYVYTAADVAVRYVPGNYWTVQMPIAEAVG